MLDIGDLAKFAGGGTWMPGYVTSVQWWCVKGPRTPSIWIAVPEEGRFTHPAPIDGLVTPMLALLYQEGKPAEVLCLLMNGTKEEIVAVEPLVAQSAIVASVPAIQYSRELLQPRDENQKTVIAPGKVGEWRVPCSVLLDLIPQEELAKIEAAGGDIDFVWKVGDLRSAALPLSIGKVDVGAVQKDAAETTSSPQGRNGRGG